MTTDTPVPDSEDDEDTPLTFGTLRARLAELDGLPDATPVILQKDGDGRQDLASRGGR